MRTPFDKIVWNDFERAKRGPEGVRAGTARIIPRSPPYISPDYFVVGAFLFLDPSLYTPNSFMPTHE